MVLRILKENYNIFQPKPNFLNSGGLKPHKIHLVFGYGSSLEFRLEAVRNVTDTEKVNASDSDLSQFISVFYATRMRKEKPPSR